MTTNSQMTTFVSNEHSMLTRNKFRVFKKLSEVQSILFDGNYKQPTENISLSLSLFENNNNNPFTQTSIQDLVTDPLPLPTKRFIMVFDTETTGLIPYRKKDEMPPYKLEFPIERLNKEYPYVTQLSFLVYDLQSCRIIQKFNSYIKIPDDIIIPDIVSQITGITREQCNQGMSIIDALTQFYIAWRNCDEIVAHNLWFDRTMINIEIRRNFMQLPKYSSMTSMFHIYGNQVTTTCSMLMGKSALNLTKYPKLSELYEHLFKEKIETYNIPLHNSLVDTLVCLKCVLELHQSYNSITKYQTITKKYFKYLIDELL